MRPSPQVLAHVLARAQDHCECTLPICGHHTRCTNTISDASADPPPLSFADMSPDLGDPGNWLALCPECLAVWSTGKPLHPAE